MLLHWLAAVAMHLAQALLCGRAEQGRSRIPQAGVTASVCHIHQHVGCMDTSLSNNYGKKNQLPSLLLDEDTDWLALRICISCQTHPSTSEFEIAFLLLLFNKLLGPFRPFAFSFGRLFFFPFADLNSLFQ